MNKDLKELIKYQNLDKTLIKLEKQKMASQDSDEKKMYKESIREKQNQLIKLDEKSKVVLDNIKKDIEVAEKGFALADKYLNTDLESLSDEELEKLITKCKKAISGYDIMQKKLVDEQNAAKDIIGDYSVNKKEIIAMKKKMASLDSSNSETKEEKDKIIADMSELEKVISKDMMDKYKEIRESKFPVITKMDDSKKCYACGAVIPEKNLEEIHKSEFTICESCHRIIIKV